MAAIASLSGLAPRAAPARQGRFAGSRVSKVRKRCDALTRTAKNGAPTSREMKCTTR